MKKFSDIIFLIIVTLFFNYNITIANETNSNQYNFSSYKTINYDLDSIANQIKKNEIHKAEKKLINISDENKDFAEYYIFLGEIELQRNNQKEALQKFNKAEEMIENVFSNHLSLSAEEILKSTFYNHSTCNKYLLYNEFAKLYLLYLNNPQKALEYSNKAMCGDTLEKEFIKTRIDILNKYRNTNPKSIIKSNMFIAYIPEIKTFKDTAADWNIILEKLNILDEKIYSRNYTWGEFLSLTPQQRISAKQKKETIPVVYLTKIALTYSLGYARESYNLGNDIIEKIVIGTYSKTILPKLYFINAMILCDKFQEYSKSIPYISKAIEFDPTNDDYYLQRSYIYMKTNKFEKAFKDINKCIELKPNNSIAYEHKANYLEYRGKQKEAFTIYKKALEINPNSKNAQKNIDRIEKILKKEQEDANLGIDRYTRTRLNVSASLFAQLKYVGLIKKAQKGNNKTLILIVNEKKWFQGSVEGYISTMEILEEYALLRGYDYIDIRSNLNGQLINRYRIICPTLP